MKKQIRRKASRIIDNAGQRDPLANKPSELGSGTAAEAAVREAND